MLAKLDYIRQLEDHTRMYTVISHLLESFGYSLENRLHPKDFNEFMQRAENEKGATYSALEKIICKIDRYEQPKSLPKKFARHTFEAFTLPMQALLYLKDRVWSSTGNEIAGILSAVAGWYMMGLAISYSTYKLNNPQLKSLLYGWLITQFFAFVVVARDVLRYNLSDPEVSPVFERLKEIKGSVLQKVQSGYDIIRDVKYHFVNKGEGV